MTRPSVEFLRYLLGLRRAHTSLTAAEHGLLGTLAAGCKRVIEVGVFEGATSAVLAASMRPEGTLWLVDPFVPGTRPERLLHLSYSRHIARRSVRRWQDRVRFVRAASAAAAAQMSPRSAADLIFIDADHSYRAVRADFVAWSPHLAPSGVLAFHDSRMCDARPDLARTDGPVRLVDEIMRGEHGQWKLAAAVDSISAFRSASA